MPLSSPVGSILVERFEGSSVRVGAATVQGLRPYHEEKYFDWLVPIDNWPIYDA